MAEEFVTTEHIQLTAEDGHTFDAYVADPGDAKAAIVVVQEIFGINRHIRSVVDDFANEGFLAVAPALFDRVERGVELAYTPEDRQRGMPMARSIGEEKPLLDIAAAMRWAADKVGSRVGVVGYCWGGTLAWLSAARLTPQAAVAYYGGRISDHGNERLNAPVVLHFGSQDKHIGPDAIEKIREAHPEVPIYIYDADHGFNCWDRASYDEKSAAEARALTLDFFRKELLG